MTLLKIVTPSSRDRWINPAHVMYVDRAESSLTLFMVNGEREVADFKTEASAAAFIQAISLHGSPRGVS